MTELPLLSVLSFAMVSDWLGDGPVGRADEVGAEGPGGAPVGGLGAVVV